MPPVTAPPRGLLAGMELQTLVPAGAGPEHVFGRPWSVCIGPDCSCFVVDRQDSKVVRVPLRPGSHRHRHLGPSPLPQPAPLQQQPVEPDGAAPGAGAGGQLKWPKAVAARPDGSVIIADAGNCRLKLLLPRGGGVVDLAGTGAAGYADGDGPVARFSGDLSALAVRRDGSVVVIDGQTIRVIDGLGTERPCRVRTAVRPERPPPWLDLNPPVDGEMGPDGPDAALGPLPAPGPSCPAQAKFLAPAGVAVLPNGDLLVCDRGSRQLRQVSAAGGVSILAGSGAYGQVDGVGPAAAFRAPFAVAVDVFGNAVVSDCGHWSSTLRLVHTRTGVVSTLRLRQPSVPAATDARRPEAAARGGGGAGGVGLHPPGYQHHPIDRGAGGAAAAGQFLQAPRQSAQAAGLTSFASVAIDGDGHIICADANGLHLITGTGLGPGLFPWTLRFWRATRACHRSSLPAARAAVWAVLLAANRIAGRPGHCALPPLPVEMWHHALGMLPPWRLGPAPSSLSGTCARTAR